MDAGFARLGDTLQALGILRSCEPCQYANTHSRWPLGPTPLVVDNGPVVPVDNSAAGGSDYSGGGWGDGGGGGGDWGVSSGGDWEDGGGGGSWGASSGGSVCTKDYSLYMYAYLIYSFLISEVELDSKQRS